jgi:hypothetical protein
MVCAPVFRLPLTLPTICAGIAGAILALLLIGWHHPDGQDRLARDPGSAIATTTRAPVRKIDAAFLLARRTSPHRRKIAFDADVVIADTIAAETYPAATQPADEHSNASARPAR